MNERIKTKITVQRIAEAGAAAHSYRITKLVGAPEVTLNAVVRDQAEETFMAGDRITHDKLKRLCEISVYEVTILSPAK
jgi:hypothetical protein